MEKDNPVIEGEKFRNMIECLQFLCHRSAPDISTAVDIMSQYSTKPTSFLTKSLKRVFGYLKSTRDYGLSFNLNNKTDEFLKFYSEANFA